MRASVLYIFISVSTLTECVTVNRYSGFNHINTEYKIELKPFTVECGLGDIIRISAPVVTLETVLYRLSKPTGDVIKLDIKPTLRRRNITQYSTEPINAVLDIKTGDYDSILVKFGRNKQPIITPEDNFEIINANLFQNVNSSDKVGEKFRDMKENEFVIGPLADEDFGNWVMSMFYIDRNGQWVEAYQVISVLIIDFVPAKSGDKYPSEDKLHRIVLRTNETFQPMFVYPIKDLRSCELTAPKSSYDRFYEKSLVDMENCAYLVKNITEADSGMWRIVGVGNIVYQASIKLDVSD